MSKADATVPGIFTWDNTLLCSTATSGPAPLLQATSLLVLLPVDFCAGSFVGLSAFTGARVA